MEASDDIFRMAVASWIEWMGGSLRLVRVLSVVLCCSKLFVRVQQGIWSIIEPCIFLAGSVLHVFKYYTKRVGFATLLECKLIASLCAYLWETNQKRLRVLWYVTLYGEYAGIAVKRQCHHFALLYGSQTYHPRALAEQVRLSAYGKGNL
jgi:hypothetical protein